MSTCAGARGSGGGCPAGCTGWADGIVHGYFATLTCFEHKDRDEYLLRVVLEDGTASVEAVIDSALVARRTGVPLARHLLAAMDTEPGVKAAAARLTRAIPHGMGLMMVRVPRECAHAAASQPGAHGHAPALPVVMSLPDDEPRHEWHVCNSAEVHAAVREAGYALLRRCGASARRASNGTSIH